MQAEQQIEERAHNFLDTYLKLANTSLSVCPGRYTDSYFAMAVNHTLSSACFDLLCGSDEEGLETANFLGHWLLPCRSGSTPSEAISNLSTSLSIFFDVLPENELERLFTLKAPYDTEGDEPIEYYDVTFDDVVLDFVTYMNQKQSMLKPPSVEGFRNLNALMAYQYSADQLHKLNSAFFPAYVGKSPTD